MVHPVYPVHTHAPEPRTFIIYNIIIILSACIILSSSATCISRKRKKLYYYFFFRPKALSSHTHVHIRRPVRHVKYRVSSARSVINLPLKKYYNPLRRELARTQ